MDAKGSYGDSRRDGVPKTKKMYNHTCDIAAEMGFDDRWIRDCPAGVRSCFWAEARYDRQGKYITKHVKLHPLWHTIIMKAWTRSVSVSYMTFCLFW